MADFKRTVRTIDHGWEHIVGSLRKLDGAKTKIGYIRDINVSNKRRTRQGEIRYNSSQDLIKVAHINERGQYARPFMSTSFDENKEALFDFSKETYKDMVDGHLSVEDGMYIIGEKGEEVIRDKIVNLMDPPNKKSTIAKKGRDDPLVETGLMRDLCTHKEVYKK